MDQSKLEVGDFSKCLNEEFRAQVEGGEILKLELVEARDLAVLADDTEFRRPFSLIFRGPGETPLKQGTFRVENDNLGTLDLFLVTLGPDKEGKMRHESVFA